MPNTVQPVFLIDWEWQVIRSHLLLGESGPRQRLHGADGGHHGIRNQRSPDPKR
jgi:hypothetical protein